MRLKESITREPVREKSVRDTLSSLGFSIPKYNPWGGGGPTRDDAFIYEYDGDDYEMTLGYYNESDEEESEYDGYAFEVFTEDGRHGMTSEAMTLGTCLKCAKLIVKYFEEVPATTKNFKIFNDKYNLDLDVF